MALIAENIPLVSAPEPSPLLFEDGITHPELWLWDSWTCWQDKQLNLFCLALSRHTTDGRPILPQDRNLYPFHIRHFTSMDKGKSWRDMGQFFAPDPQKSYMNRNVWSGCVTPYDENRFLFGFTGIQENGPDRQFLQTIGLAISDGDKVIKVQDQPLSCPMRDYEAIISKGYYLGPKDELGANSGEGGGPILAWRDPYFVIEDGKIEAFWSAKVSPKEGAVAHATLIETNVGFEIETLHPPILLPYEDMATQAEVPKIYGHKGDYYLLISACDRLYEGQPDSEVHKMIRLYRSEALRGPWRPYHDDGSRLTTNDELFGASITQLDKALNVAEFICPITEMASPDRQLTFAPMRQVQLNATPKDILKL